MILLTTLLVEVPDGEEKLYDDALSAARVAFAFAGLEARVVRVEHRPGEVSARTPAVNAVVPKGAPS